MADAIPPVKTPNPYADLVPKTTTAQGSADKNMFLQLLVAQLRNQDPLKPNDSMQFVGQLAQFQQLETGLNSARDIAAIREQLDLLAKSKSESES